VEICYEKSTIDLNCFLFHIGDMLGGFNKAPLEYLLKIGNDVIVLPNVHIGKNRL